MHDLRLAIVHVNSTRVDLSLATGLSSWITSAMNHLKEWAGIGSLTGVLVLTSLVGLWCICKIRVSQKRDAAMIVQAFTAIEAGQSPQQSYKNKPRVQVARLSTALGVCGLLLAASRRACLIYAGWYRPFPQHVPTSFPPLKKTGTGRVGLNSGW